MICPLQENPSWDECPMSKWPCGMQMAIPPFRGSAHSTSAITVSAFSRTL